MKDLEASDVMMRPVVSARKNASGRDVALQLLSGLYSGLPVTDEEGRVIGVITEMDLIKAAVEGKELVKTTAEELMSKEPITADIHTPVTEIVNIMTERNIIRLPITSRERLVGIVARCDILKSLIEPEFATYV